MLLRKAFAKAVLPAIFRNLVFHPSSLEFRESRMNWKSCFLGFWWKMGKPKYFPNTSLALILRSWAKVSLRSFSQLWEKITLDFEELIFCPKKWLKLLWVFKMVYQIFESALTKRIRSSAKKRWERLGPLLLIEMGVQLRMSISWFILLDRSSMYIIKR